MTSRTDLGQPTVSVLHDLYPEPGLVLMLVMNFIGKEIAKND
jgi:hypothetical protein